MAGLKLGRRGMFSLIMIVLVCSLLLLSQKEAYMELKELQRL